MPGIRTGLAGALLIAPTLALAAGSATLEADSFTLEVAWQDAATMRMVPQGQSGYMLVRDGTLYSVSQAGGRTIVMDMSAMGQMMGGMGGQSGQGGAAMAPGPDQIASVTAIEATGRAETVAGIEGEIHTVRWRDKQGGSHTDEAVLSADPLAVELTRAFQGFAQASARAMGQDQPDPLGQAILDKGMGFLRFGDRMRLTAISGNAPAADRFELPAEPMDPSQFGGMPGGG